MRLLVFTLGFEEKFAIRAFTRRGLDVGDRILLVAARPAADRVVRAYNTLREFVQRYYGGGVEIELVEVNVRDFPGAVCEIRRRVLEKAGGDVVVNLSGGPRALVLATYAAVQLLPDDVAKRVRVEVEFEDGTYLVEVPLCAVYAQKLAERLGEEKLAVLEKLAQRGVATAEELAREVNLDSSTVRRHIRRLEELGLVQVLSKRPLRAELTQDAKVITCLRE
ncbi:CRISPR-associated CARF protein Csa3 [Pyrobaculum calidifontis]|uniref:CRISPR-associated CARF protein Csa3 n=1 Tax=Pyrobaculum calidifontis TaxID=181486 RepID=UPI00186B6742|nr:CRISPR-associated CARF protein Csa3 [Pyrobaculum calidifontis]